LRGRPNRTQRARAAARCNEHGAAWAEQEKPQQGHLDWFTEGFETRDLKEAKASPDMLTPR
jgi:hypothetical protein